MRARLRLALPAAVLCGLLAGCSGDPDQPGDDDGGSAGDDSSDGGGGDTGDGDQGGDDSGDQSGDDGAVAPDPIAGQYEIVTTYDVSSSPLLPGVIGGSLSALTSLSEDPAGTFIAVLDQANLPVLDQLLAVLPDLLVDQLAGFINDFVFDRLIDGIPATQVMTDLIADLAGILTQFEVVSALELSPMDADGVSTGTHRLSGVRFGWRGDSLLVDTPALLDELTIARDVAGSATFGGGDGVLELGDHAFHLPLGDFAVIGIDLAVQQTFGVEDLRAALGAVVDCPGLAESVATRCIGPICVGHRDEVQAVCESGLDLVVAQIEERITSIDFTEMRFSQGDAVLRDAGEDGGAQDGLVDRIESGNWQCTVEVDGVGAVPLPSPFVGHRIGAAVSD